MDYYNIISENKEGNLSVYKGSILEFDNSTIKSIGFNI